MIKLENWKVPILSTSVVRLMSIGPTDPQYFETVMTTVSRDAGLASQAFNLANSVAFARSEPCSSLGEAMMRLGARRFVAMALGGHMVNVFVPASREMSQLWSDAIRCATANRVLANTYPELEVQEYWALIVGLLHKAGSLILAHNEVERYREILGQTTLDRPDILQLEEAAFGINHVELGLKAAVHWNLPTNLVEVMRYHFMEELPEHVLFPELVWLTQLARAILRNDVGASMGLAAKLHLDLDEDELRGELLPMIESEAWDELSRLGVPFLD